MALPTHTITPTAIRTMTLITLPVLIDGLRAHGYAIDTIMATGGGTITWEPRDVFTLPSSAAMVHHAEETSYLFMCTDGEILSRLGLLTEEFVP